ncbi:MAG: hypothetical protein JO076_05995 [Verrucomicrobia bacterium]|nr:hypothetical protein [Verrucomicrobiota bacterium]
MSSKFGNYLFRNLKGQSADSTENAGTPVVESAFLDHPIELGPEDFKIDDPVAPKLDWSNIEGSIVKVRLKDTQGIMEGRVTIKASILKSAYPSILPGEFNTDYQFPVSLKSVVLQVQASLKRSDPAKLPGPEFETPIAQVAREDEGFFKLEQAKTNSHSHEIVPVSENKTAPEPNLTPADRPTFPLIKEKPRPAGKEVPPLEVSIPPPTSSSALTEVASTPFTPSETNALKRGEPASQDGAAGFFQPDPRKPLHRIGLERLQEIFMTEDLLDGRHVAKLIAEFPRVRGALIMLQDGTLIGGDLPPEFNIQAALSAPTFMCTLREFSARLQREQASALTIYQGGLPMSIFSEGSVLIFLVHSGPGLPPGMRERIGQIAQALSALYT